MTLLVNDQPTDVPEGTTLKALLVILGYEGAVVAVALDGTFVPRAQHATTPLQPGSRVEIVAPMQGG